MSADDDTGQIEGPTPTLEEIDERIELGERDADMIGWLIVHELSDGEQKQVGAPYREAAYNLGDAIVESGLSAWRYRHKGGLITSDIGETVDVRTLLTPDVCDAIVRWRRHRAFRAGLNADLETDLESDTDTDTESESKERSA